MQSEILLILAIKLLVCIEMTYLMLELYSSTLWHLSSRPIVHKNLEP